MITIDQRLMKVKRKGLNEKTCVEVCYFERVCMFQHFCHLTLYL